MCAGDDEVGQGADGPDVWPVGPDLRRYTHMCIHAYVYVYVNVYVNVYVYVYV